MVTYFGLFMNGLTDSGALVRLAYKGLQALDVNADEVLRRSGFDPSKLKKHPPVTDPERLEYERGLGVTLMRRLTDECSITPSKNGTTVTLIVHR